MSDSEPSASASPKGIGGWLVLPLIGMFITSLIFVLSYAAVAVGTPRFADLPPEEVWFWLFDFTLALAVYVAAPAALLVLMFKHRIEFPAYYVIWIWAVPALYFCEGLLLYLTRPGLPGLAGDEPAYREAFRVVGKSILPALIWTPYMILSRRVENTFVK